MRRDVLAATLIAVAAYAAAFVVLMQRRDDISWFVVAGGSAVDPSRIPAGLSIIPGIEGYDGMAFYRLALDPFTRKANDFGVALDNPPYRQQRIVYPLLVHLASFGRAEWVPTLLVIVNLVAVGALTMAAAATAVRSGISALWGLVVPSYPGFFLAFSRDTAEIVAWAFAVAGIYAITARRSVLAAVLLTCAVLARETTLLLVVAVGVVHAWQVVTGRERSTTAIAFIIPTIAYVAWQLVLFSWWGTSGLQAGTLDRTVPFSGYLAIFVEAAARRTVPMRVHFAECVFWALVVACVLIFGLRKTARAEWRIAWIGYLTLAAVLGRDVWSEHISFMRVLSDLFVISALTLFNASGAVRWVVLIASASVSIYVLTHLR